MVRKDNERKERTMKISWDEVWADIKRKTWIKAKQNKKKCCAWGKILFSNKNVSRISFKFNFFWALFVNLDIKNKDCENSIFFLVRFSDLSIDARSTNVFHEISYLNFMKPTALADLFIQSGLVIKWSLSLKLLSLSRRKNLWETQVSPNTSLLSKLSWGEIHIDRIHLKAT